MPCCRVLRHCRRPTSTVARLVTGTRRTDHIMPVLQSLHWLPVQQRVTFKLETLVHKCLNGRAPAYLADDFCLAGCGRPGSWSATSMMLDIPRTTTSLGDKSICRRRTACLEQPSSCHPRSVTVVINLRKAAENLFVCLRVTALVTYKLAPWKCTD